LPALGAGLVSTPLTPDRERAGPFLTKSEYAYVELRRRIVEGELPPGTRLMLRPLAERLGVSVMPVRDAIRMLERDGLVETKNHRGATVTTISREDVIEALSVRMWLEVLAVRQATPRHTDATLEAARRALAGAEKAAPRGGLAYAQANRALHEAIEAPAPPVARQAISDLWDRVWQTRRSMSLFVLAPDRIPGAETDHREIFAAVERGDAGAAAEAMSRHRDSSLRAWDGVLGRHPTTPGRS
jgi:DNA-binding GntR family transcriptional regulator